MSAVARKLGRPVDADPEQTRRQILPIAMRHFGRYGYAQTTIKSIAEEAELTSGAVYYHFDSKQRLLETLAAAVVEESAAHLRATLAGHRRFTDRIVALIDEVRARYLADPDHARLWLVLADDVARYPELRHAYDTMVGAYDALFAEVVDDAVEAGELDKAVDRQAVIDVLVALVTGITRLLATLPGSRRDAVVESAKRLVRGDLFTTTGGQR